MRVFSNTTPLLALSSIGRLHLLEQLFGTVSVASSVVDECREGGRIAVPNLTAIPWIQVQPDEEATSLPVLFELDRGEKQTLLLAIRQRADLVLIDERLGRRTAEYLGLKFTGTLGILLKARAAGLIPSFLNAAMAMKEQGIYYNSALIHRLAMLVGEMRREAPPLS